MAGNLPATAKSPLKHRRLWAGERRRERRPRLRLDRKSCSDLAPAETLHRNVCVRCDFVARLPSSGFRSTRDRSESLPCDTLVVARTQPETLANRTQCSAPSTLSSVTLLAPVPLLATHPRAALAGQGGDRVEMAIGPESMPLRHLPVSNP